MAGAVLVLAPWVLRHHLQGPSSIIPFWVCAIALGLGLIGLPWALLGVAVGASWHLGQSAIPVAALMVGQWWIILTLFQRRQASRPGQSPLEQMLDLVVRIHPGIALAGNCARVTLLGFIDGQAGGQMALQIFQGFVADSLGALLAFCALGIFRGLKHEIGRRPWEALTLIFIVCLFGVTGNMDIQAQGLRYSPRPTFFFPLAVWAGMRLGPAMTGLVLILSATACALGLALGEGRFTLLGAEAGFDLLIFLTTLTFTGLLWSLVWGDRNRAEHELRLAETRSRALIENAPEAIVVVDADTGVFIQNNPQAEKLYRLPGDTLKTLGPAQLSPEYQADGRLSGDLARQYIGQALQGETPIFEWMHVDGEGRELPCEVRLMRLPDPHRNLVRGTLIDISDRVKARKAVLEGERALAKAQAIAHLGSFVYQPADGTAIWSREMYRLFDIPLDGKPLTREEFLNCVVPEDRPKTVAMRENISQGKSFTDEIQVVLASGRSRHFQISADIDNHETTKAPFLVGTMLDITDRKAAELQVRALNQELEARVAQRTAELETANRSLESFSYSVSHDLRAPLRSLDGFSRALEEEYGEKFTGEARDYLGRIRRASQRMAALIDDLLELTRLSRKEMSREALDISLMAEEIALGLRQSDPQRQVEFHIAQGLQGFGDPGLVRIAMDNLLGNAWKFTAKIESARISVKNAAWENRQAICIADNGAGFDMTYSNKLFGAFQRLHAREEFDGNGIGLALVERIIRRHGGSIAAKGKVNGGAEFFFTLGAEASS